MRELRALHARLGWPAVALAVSLVAFFSVLRIVSAVLSALQLLAEQLDRRIAQTSHAVTRIEENQERMAIVLDRLVERTQPGMGPAIFPPQDPQRA